MAGLGLSAPLWVSAALVAAALAIAALVRVTDAAMRSATSSPPSGPRSA
jgi:hypothetical protein